MSLQQYLVRLVGDLPTLPNPEDPANPLPDYPHNTAIVGQYSNGDNSVLVADEVPPTFGTLVGGWQVDGPITDPVTNDFYEIRPLGNNPDGTATKQLQYTYPAGWSQRYLRSDGLYPADNDAMAIEVRHKEFTGAWAGWGWRAEIRYVAEQRPPNARAIGIYRDEDASDYHYTTGAFILQDSDWQVDEEGNPLQVWATETPAGFATPTKEPIHHALLLGAAQEGHQTLWPEDDSTEFLYWAQDLQQANRLVFKTVFESQGGIVQPNSWNRVVLKFGAETHRVTWGQIIRRTLPALMSDPMKQRVNYAAEQAGWEPPDTP